MAPAALKLFLNDIVIQSDQRHVWFYKKIDIIAGVMAVTD